MALRAMLAKSSGCLISAALLTLATDAAAQGRSQRKGRAGEAASTGEVNGVDAAMDRFRAAIDLTSAGRFSEALDKFQEAYDISPTYKLLYNIGQLSKHVGDSARSLRSFEQYLAEGGQEIGRARRIEVEGYIASLRGQVGSVRVALDLDGASVFIDAVKVADAPMIKPYYVNPGAHQLRVEAPGKAPIVKGITVAAGQLVDMQLSLTPAAPTAQAPALAPPQAPPPSADTTPPPAHRPTWIGWVATGALAAGAGVAGVWTLVSRSELDETSFTGKTPPEGSTAAELQDRVKTLGLVTDVLAAAAAVSLGVTLYFTLKAPSPAAPRAASSTLVATVGANGVSIRGSF